MRVSRIVSTFGPDAVIKVSMDAHDKFDGIAIKFYQNTPEFQAKVGKVADEFLSSDLPKTDRGIAEAIKRVFYGLKKVDKK